MNINLTISKNRCIESASKKEYEKLIKRYFSRQCTDFDKTIIEPQIEALKFFIENADFASLRSLYPEIRGTYDYKLVAALNIPPNYYDITIVFGDFKIQPKWRQ